MVNNVVKAFFNYTDSVLNVHFELLQILKQQKKIAKNFPLVTTKFLESISIPFKIMAKENFKINTKKFRHTSKNNKNEYENKAPKFSPFRLLIHYLIICDYCVVSSLAISFNYNSFCAEVFYRLLLSLPHFTAQCFT